MLAVFYALVWIVTIDGVIMPLCSGKFVFVAYLSKLVNPSGVNLDLDSFLTNWRESHHSEFAGFFRFCRLSRLIVFSDPVLQIILVYPS